MIEDLESLLRRLDKTQENYLELLDKYHALIHEYEVLKEQVENYEKDKQ